MPHPRLHAPLAAALSTRGYDELTSVQTAVLAEEARGRDLIVSAKTGSGKTLAFGMAMAGELLEADGLPYTRTPLALVIAPTRELAIQVGRELGWLYGTTSARVVTCVGGMDPMRERRALSGGANIVVGTPGRLRDHLERGALDLSSLRAAILDEADEMLDMGFRDELEEILDATPSTRRTLLFSATIPRPIVALARRYQRDALRIETTDNSQGHQDIAYQAVAVSPTDIEHAVVNLLRFHDAETAIVFCATREAVRRLHASLTERGFQAVALSGEHSQNERNHALQALRDQRARVCVATDVAARGIDLPSVSLVIHAELPRDAEGLQHRSGRTGRAGRKGTAVLVVPYPRRKRVEGILREARVTAEWIDPPSPAEIHRRDRERLLAAMSEPVELQEEDRDLAEQLMAKLDPSVIAGTLVRSLRVHLPPPEDILSAKQRGEAREGGPRPGFEGAIWFRLNAGRRHNADPRWLLPLICRYGHVGRADIGAIRIAANESYFQVSERDAVGFTKPLRSARIDPEDQGLIIEPAVPRGPSSNPPDHGHGRVPKGKKRPRRSKAG